MLDTALFDPQGWVLCAAFWASIGACRGGAPARQVLGLLAGAAAAHAGWMFLHADRLLAAGIAVPDPTRGFCVLFVPLGPLGVTLASSVGSRRAHLAQMGAILPIGFAIARLGCLIGGCCGGRALDGAFTHPTPLYEAIGWAIAHGLVRRAPSGDRFAWVCVFLGALRLAVEPWRATPPLGSPWMPVEVVAMVLVIGGSTDLAWRRIADRGRLGRAVPGASLPACSVSSPRRIGSG